MDFIDLKTRYRGLRNPINSRVPKALEHGQYIMGPEVAELEDRLTAHIGSKHCITVASGTESLARRVVILPMHTDLDEATQDRIVEVVRQTVPKRAAA